MTRIRGLINRYVLLSYQNENKSGNIAMLRKLIIYGKGAGQRKLSIKANKTHISQYTNARNESNRFGHFYFSLVTNETGSIPE